MITNVIDDRGESNKGDTESDDHNQPENHELSFEEIDSNPRTIGGNRVSKGKLDKIPDHKIIAVDKTDRLQLIKKHHDGYIGGQRGINAVETAINENYYWSSMHKDISEYIKNCEHCQKFKIIRQNKNLPIVISELKGQPFERISIDIAGPYRYSGANSSAIYSLTIQDNFSKYIRSAPLQDTTGERVMETILKYWISYFEAPVDILSDNAPNLIAGCLQKFRKKLGINMISSSSYHPQTNGTVKRSHARLAEYLGTTLDELKEDMDWETRLSLARLCYNQTIHSTTCYSPHELLFGIKPNVFKVPHIRDIAEDRIDVIKNHLGNIRKNASKNDLNKKNKSKERYAKKTTSKTINYELGQLVLANNLAISNNKLKQKWIGPYRIIKLGYV
ncbi:unnamed protein product [Hermetia illucens]|uniref:RNA-directed DNA polymerase n=1 Tax=Hermetia illucens TaxID=343691 RepID=A0A7R8V4X9_HERIL|nr:unnamed protein product [Hermetia illucens]